MEKGRRVAVKKPITVADFGESFAEHPLAVGDKGKTITPVGLVGWIVVEWDLYPGWMSRVGVDWIEEI